jgi:hypothetical protein
VGDLGPVWVAEVVALIGLVGLLTALLAAGRGRAFVPWLLYGVSLPVVALPHALLGVEPKARREAPPARLRRALAFAPGTLGVVVGLAAIDVVCLDFHRELFGPAWQYVMWEGGVCETLTPVNFLLGAAVFTSAAIIAVDDRRRRWWLALYAVVDVVLAGEEVSWGTGQILLDLADPDFVSRYNRPTTIHHFLPGVAPIIVFFVVVGLFRLFYSRVRAGLGVPMSVGFLNAVLLTLLAAPLMRFDHPHFLFFDEMYEWSGSVLLLSLAMRERWRWFFTA